ncbi:hypothetical protein V5N11_017534 [Cardamine amara subsp. amara]|uniref:Uncharacterized protein n=1 Tax=Cardamine amara subsp. amara TaxID=228776 RepID=A0ABD0ZG32_CARAN
MENVVVVARDGDEELSLFLEMRRREKFQIVSSPPEPGRNGVDKSSTESLVLTTTRCVELRRSAVEKFLDSENDKSDYEWLLAAPDTLQGQENSMVKLKEPTTSRFTALKPRVENIPQEPVTRSVKAFKPIPRTAFSKQVNTIAELKSTSKPSRQATPTSRATLPSKRETNSTRNANTDNRTSSTKSNPRASVLTRSSSVGKSVSNAKSTSITIPEVPARPVSTSRSRVVYSSGDRSKGRSKISNDVNPVLMGAQMVERVVNMRKLPPPKQDDNMSSGFGRTLSRSSLDMALRHMNIRRSVSKNLRVTINAPTNSMDRNESL